ncbi:hypothetical protein QO074_02940 [Campylobacter jejuni]|nr:hypothetical protein [Campylobacter jejuni]EEP3803219.1 hypothetical protein [Campylobacter jejuni]
MKVCRSNYLEIVKIVPFSERRSCFCHFLRSNGIAIEKINYKNHISKKELRKAYKIYKSKPNISFLKVFKSEKNMKVIGNIHENADLLVVKE